MASANSTKADITCPRCASKTLSAEMYEGIEIDRCQTCRGTWLDAGEVSKILDRKIEKFAASEVQASVDSTRPGASPLERKETLPCPRCSYHMEIVNYRYASGIIIDNCPQLHGVWLDARELEKIQMYSEGWELICQDKQAEWLQLASKDSEAIITSAIDAYKGSSIFYSGAHKLVYKIGRYLGKF